MAKPNIIDLRSKLPRNGVFPTRPLSAVRIFAVHYDGTDVADDYDPVALYIQEAQFHISKNWCSTGVCHGYGIEYTYSVARDGQVYQLEDEEALTWNAMNANTLDLAIKVDSGPNTPPTPEQFDALNGLLMWLCNERPEMPAGRGDVYGHGELVEYGNSTSCPGAQALTWVRAFRSGVVPQPPTPTPTKEAQIVTIASVIGEETYKPVPNLIQIRLWVQAIKALEGAY